MPLPERLPPAPSEWERLVGPDAGRGGSAARRPGRPPARTVRPALDRERRPGRVLAPLLLAVLLVAAGAWAAQGMVAATPAPPALDPVLVQRYEQAKAAAAADGVTLEITSGLRSAEDQQALIDKELARRGSAEEAHRWVAPVQVSAHVLGKALDIGPTEGALWMRDHGSQFGLCPVFDNEPWHVEALTEPGGTCPPTLPDASSLWD